MEIIIFTLILNVCVYLELITLHKAFYVVTHSNEITEKILRKNWKLVLCYLVIAALLFPITILSTVLPGVRTLWENTLINSIKNNKGIL